MAPTDELHAAILVEGRYTEGRRRGQPRTFEELWAGAVYELHNVCFAREFVRLNEKAEQGKVPKTVFVADILRLELRAAQQTRAFYAQAYLPWVEKQKRSTDPSLWFCDWWDTPETVLSSFSDRSAYPWRPYARMHDWATVHRYWRHGLFDRAMRLLRQMRGEQGYDEDQEDIADWIQRVRQWQKDD